MKAKHTAKVWVRQHEGILDGTSTGDIERGLDEDLPPPLPISQYSWKTPNVFSSSNVLKKTPQALKTDSQARVPP